MPDRPRRPRPRRALLAALVTFAVAVPVSGAARPAAVPAPAPTAIGPLRDASAAALEERYAVSRSDIRAAGRAAEAHGDLKRAASLRAMAAPGRRFLSFDGRDGGRSVEVVGELSSARRIAVLVPGAGVGLDAYARLRRDARALHRELGEGAAVVAWLGYRSPATVSPAALTTGRADGAAPELRALVDGLRAVRPAARISLLCHSYGSVICARSAHGTAADALVLYGSPGVGSDRAAALRTGARVWAGRSGGDWIARVPHVRVRVPFVATVGFGTDPVAERFGAEVFDAGDGGHSDYLRPGSRSLTNLARIAAGSEPLGASR
ncbi:alpha/beta hydrolase [Streptomyces sp. ATCC51928]|uniref:Alpha/beta hydrolase n=1 Tax=Streptomyces caviscabies TaxID=90079 RepID=A0ABW2MCZ4_9ACTN|nr:MULTISPECIES: alpha/beta hydrolase [unclassified Streptomyces]MDX3506549.1 alpha/beta hydrolase [Streptomyces sp. ATCC51928]MDX5519798.1 alpha/beta hydrolase [Streptomyces sp. DE06-01C]